jgi:nitrogen-specific signal transduction histidine kinase
MIVATSSRPPENTVQYELLFRRMPLPVALVDRDLVVHDASEAYSAFVGVELRLLLGTSLQVAFADAEAATAAREAAGGAAPFDATATLAPDGQPVRVRIAGLDGEEGRALVVVTPADSGEEPRVAELYAAIRSIKHEINNPLTGALGNINLLLRRADLDDKTRRRLATAEQEIKKVSQVVMRLSELAAAPKPPTG